ncbi:MAG: excinuclease ABC subunit UvrA [Candidatus Krumholzibacteria bacterium]|jgi:excinuclease ABC subunit A|nr:excinuclease ABC subunit UvrA [Candidatus Krumholzibacteria bacterium]MDP6670031.1 excinuclease ABC subunit UvrA [Candidatus Krumholzibacteria bacterium]MDP6797711.1 excinuclease ABC subunit UvrA [Candidatus Krumholzibacteria bacterium]MDP7022605.1 excinuclease ABC subunit UvrA [Candidatus Krumholzibacteria bacterium]
MDRIILRGARENNLRNIDLDLPRGKLLVISGVSGSGKSSLLFDTLYAEGQRRYVESLSTYTRQFLERIRRPELDSLEGIGPALAIRQKNSVFHSRSTVATYTEIADFLRILFSRVGRIYCPNCRELLQRDDASSLALSILEEHSGKILLLAFPLEVRKGVKPEALRELLQSRGFVRILEGGKLRRIREIPDSGLQGERLSIVVDRLKVESKEQSRLAESIETAYREGDGRLELHDPDAGLLERHAEGTICSSCEREIPEPTPRFFSFQHTDGACPGCHGYGNILAFDERKIIPDLSLSLEQGALAPWSSPRFDRFKAKMIDYCRKEGIPTGASFRSLPERQKKVLLHGTRDYKGVFPWLEALRAKGYKKYARFFSRRFMSEVECEDCRGSRLRPEVESVKIGEWTYPAFSALTLGEAAEALPKLGLGDGKAEGVDRVLDELSARLSFLNRMGLHYLGLDRLTRTLSGGEFQRIHLANALGSHLTDTLYALDEPTVGLHARDTERLMETLVELRDKGNTVYLVEHDLDVIRAADELLDMGPGSGAQGGEVVFQGSPARLPRKNGDHPSATLRFLRGEEEIIPESGDNPARGHLILKGARLHNLKNIDVEFPLGQLCVISGVSGSGKSSLLATLVQAMAQGGESRKGDPFDRLSGSERISELRHVDQSPLGRSPRSNPATYIGAFQYIRELFASQPEAIKRRMGPQHFSFNSKEGRCPECSGLGSVKLEMVFMADLFVPCESCGGSRYRPASLEVKYKGRTISEVLKLTVDEAIHFFSGQHAMGQKLWMLHRVGLGYLPIGQGVSGLSGGESQRLKIARELSQSSKEKYLYVLDEPTTGLHPQDIRLLLAVFQRLIRTGHSLLVIEHNLQVLLAADHVIDLGPEGGDGGGRMIAEGSPREISRAEESLTGRYLRPWIESQKGEKP